MVILNDFIPTTEFIMYMSLANNGILPKEDLAVNWNNANHPFHKAWTEFEDLLTKYNREIISYSVDN